MIEHLPEDQAIKFNSQAIKFRFPIKVTEQWKVQSIATYKRNKRRKLENAERAVPPPELIRSTSFDSRQRTMSMDERSDLIEKQSSTIPREKLVREMEILRMNSNMIRGKINTLNHVRHSLLWLLKKGSLHEREVVHEHGRK